MWASVVAQVAYIQALEAAPAAYIQASEAALVVQAAYRSEQTRPPELGVAAGLAETSGKLTRHTSGRRTLQASALPDI